MKEFWKSWKFWAAVAAVILVIVLTVLYLCVPAFHDLIKSIAICIGCALAGFIGGFYVGKYKYAVKA